MLIFHPGMHIMADCKIDLSQSRCPEFFPGRLRVEFIYIEVFYQAVIHWRDLATVSVTGCN